MSENFESFTGKIIINAQFIAQDGQAENFAEALKEVQSYALSDKEPGSYTFELKHEHELETMIGCLTYLICRSDNLFLVFEEYKNAAAIPQHRSTPPYQSLASQASTLVVPGSRKVVFYEEV